MGSQIGTRSEVGSVGPAGIVGVHVPPSAVGVPSSSTLPIVPRLRQPMLELIVRSAPPVKQPPAGYVRMGTEHSQVVEASQLHVQGLGASMYPATSSAMGLIQPAPPMMNGPFQLLGVGGTQISVPLHIPGPVSVGSDVEPVELSLLDSPVVVSAVLVLDVASLVDVGSDADAVIEASVSTGIEDVGPPLLGATDVTPSLLPLVESSWSSTAAAGSEKQPTSSVSPTSAIDRIWARLAGPRAGCPRCAQSIPRSGRGPRLYGANVRTARS